MQVRVLSTSSEKSKGVLGRTSLDPDEIYVFTNMYPYTSFHMNGVPFSIDIGFIDQDGVIIGYKTMQPNEGNAMAPVGTVIAVEACEGFFSNNNLKTGGVWKEITKYIS